MKENVCSNAIICLVDDIIFLEGIKYEHRCYALITRVDGEEDKEISI